MIRSKEPECGAHQRVLAVAHGLGLEALEAEVEDDEVANVRVVFDDEDAGHGLDPVFHRYVFLAAPPLRPHFFHTRATALPR